MKKLIVLVAGASGSAAVSMAFFGTGVAAADDYAGQMYADASSALSKAGLTGVVATRVGDKLPQDECIVTHSQTSSFTNTFDAANAIQTNPGTQVLLYLNCNAPVASATTPGNSLGSPEGRAAAAQAAAGQSASNELAATGNTPGAP